MFNILKDIMSLAEDIATLPTDTIGLTSFREKKEARAYVEALYVSGEITEKERVAALRIIDSEKTLNL